MREGIMQKRGLPASLRRGIMQERDLPGMLGERESCRKEAPGYAGRGRRDTLHTTRVPWAAILPRYIHPSYAPRVHLPDLLT